jgi:hypothetical protein
MPTLDETKHLEIIIPECLYCGELLCGQIVDGLHKACSIQLNKELEAFDLVGSHTDENYNCSEPQW